MNIRKQIRQLPLILTAIAAVLSGCVKQEGGTPATTLKELGKDEKASIKVVFYDKNQFFSQYGGFFSFKYPNIDVQVVSNQGIYGPGKDWKAEYQKLIDTEKPDVLLFPTTELFEQWSQDGKLFAMDDIIKQDKFDIDNMLPSVVDLIKEKGGGKIYGLAPNFSSQAIFYNKDLFAKYGVPLPKDQMSWEDLFQLAKRFLTDGQGDERIYGFAPSYTMNGGRDVGYYYMNMIGLAKGLSFADPDNMKVTIQTDEWKKAAELTVDAIKSGAFYMPGKTPASDPSKPVMMQDMLKRNLFVTGKVAMTLDYSYLLDNLQRAKDMLTDVPPVSWDVVTVPVDPSNPNESNVVNVSSLFAINAQSPNIRAAWELVKFINSDDLARVTSKSSVGGLVTRAAYLKEKDGHSLEAFYKLKPFKNNVYKGYEKLPQGFFDPFTQLANEQIQAVADGKKSIDEALNEIEEKGQAELIKAKQAEDEKKASGGSIAK